MLSQIICHASDSLCLKVLLYDETSKASILTSNTLIVMSDCEYYFSCFVVSFSFHEVYENTQNILLDSRCNFFLAGFKLNKYVNYTLIYKNIKSKIYIYYERYISNTL